MTIEELNKQAQNTHLQIVLARGNYAELLGHVNELLVIIVECGVRIKDLEKALAEFRKSLKE